MDLKKLALKETFDLVPALYDEMRPGYPTDFVAQIKEYAELKKESQILEVGPGTGQMTTHFASEDCNILGLELGSAMASYLKEKFGDYKNIRIENTSFEDWQEEEPLFDMFISAQAFHWIDPDFGINKAARVLRPSGTIALVWNLDVSQQSKFYQLGNHLHEKYFPTSEQKPPDLKTFFETCFKYLKSYPAFDRVTSKELEWNKSYTSNDWIKLRSTMSPDLSLPRGKREQFHTELKQLIDEKCDGQVIRYYRSICALGRKK